ncbi:MAG: hypothetical protein OCC49_02185 [Fibrobacterales bacterium]
MKQKNVSKIMRGLVLIGICMLSSCLTTQHFNTGKTLKTGNSVVVWGVGSNTIFNCSRDYDNWEYSNNDSTVYTKTCQSNENEIIDDELAPQISRKFRLGVRDDWGPFPGVDIGYSLEAPGGVEFDGRLALPGLSESLYHSLSVGWIIGLWADNTVFLEYAFSKEVGKNSFYVNLRESYIATQAYDLEFDEDSEEMFKHNRNWATQLGFGMRHEGKRQFFFPNVFYAHGTITAPAFSFVDRIEGDMRPMYQFSPSVGVGWTY